MGLFQWLWKERQQFSNETSKHKLVKQGDRSYIEDAPYLLPKDEQEIDRLDLQHYLLRYMLQRNYLAPIHNPGRILDIGCGTGRWAIEMAESLPKTEVVGLDIVEPKVAIEGRPKNVLFMQRDVLKGIPFSSALFDYTHMRFLIAALPQNKYQDVVNAMVRVVRPGGWVEIAEPGLMINADTGLETLWNWLIVLGQRRGIDMAASEHLPRFLENAGLTNVALRAVTIPYGMHGGQAGEMAAKNIISLFGGLREPIITLKIATAVQFDHMLERTKSELANPNGSAIGPMYIAVGQRPG